MKLVYPRRSREIIVAAISLVCAFGCTRVAPSAVAITITVAPDVLIIGESSVLVATNRATGDVINARWSSSDPTVASVSNDQLSGVGAGRVTITATYEGARATASVKVVPNFAGTYPAPPDIWGLVYETECVDLSAPGYCVANIVDPERFRLELVQTKDSVSGRCVTDNVDGAVAGEIDDAGWLTLRGSLPHRLNQNFIFQMIESWSSYLDAGESMYGTFTSRFLGPGGVANFQVTQEMRGLTHGR